MDSVDPVSLARSLIDIDSTTGREGEADAWLAEHRRVTVRAATSADIPVLEDLWRAFAGEVPAPAHVELDLARELAELRETVDSGLAFLAEDDGGSVGFALARRTGARLARLTDLYVVPDARRGGVAAALVHAVVEQLAGEGVEHLDLEVMAANAGARAVYHRWGFTDDVVTLVAPVAQLRERLAPGRHAVDLIRACFPGGSITGAPKRRAMQIIEALEPERRSVYCGCIGYLGFDGDMDLNIAIRTLLCTDDRIYAWAGGGIVADSTVESEYQESLDKAAALLAILEAEDSALAG